MGKVSLDPPQQSLRILYLWYSLKLGSLGGWRDGSVVGVHTALAEDLGFSSQDSHRVAHNCL